MLYNQRAGTVSQHHARSNHTSHFLGVRSMATKQCSKCGVIKPIESFYRHPSAKLGRAPACKECEKKFMRQWLSRTGNASIKRYEKTKKGFLMRKYRGMQSRVTATAGKNLRLYGGKELLARDDFYAWAESSAQFHSLFELWVSAGYDRKLSPSVDRIDSAIGYRLDNMRWVTHSENSKCRSNPKHS